MSLNDSAEVGGGGAPRPSPVGRVVTLRALVVGAIAITLIGLMTNYNDHVVMNTYAIGSYLPPALVLTLFMMAIVVNGVLHRWWPAKAFSAGELAVILLMTVLGCSIPAQGLFRFFTPMLTGPFREGATNPRFWAVFTAMELPDWLFPVKIAEGINNPVINTFYGRVQPGDPIPWGAWLPPLLGWGVFLVAWLTSLIAMVWIFRRQWAVNERLPFPIASVEASLIASPPKGRMLNTLFSSPLFWAGLGLVLAWQSSVALHKYFPRVVPLVPLSYSLGSIMGNEPWVHFSFYVKSATVYFTFVGIAYFIQGRISFSLWATFLVAQIVGVQQRMFQNEITGEAWRDQHLGAALAFVGGFVWIGRHHLMAVGRQVIGRPGGTSLTQDENYRPVVVVFLIGMVFMALWLIVLGVQWWFALLMLGMILLSHMVTARVVAETGLPFIRADFTGVQIYSNMPTGWMGSKDLFFAAQMYVLGPVSTRESAAVFGQQALVTAEQSGVDTAKLRRSLAMVIAFSLLLAVTVSAIGSLYTHYVYATPIPAQIQHPVLDPPAMDRPRSEMYDPMVRHADGAFAPKRHSPAKNVGAGFGITAVLQWLALRSAAWPFLPVGYLLCTRWYIGQAWFSLMLGWLAKQLIVKYGGATMFQQARPLFIGLIVGEALAAGIWLLISLVLVWMGYDHQSVPMLPS